MNISKWVSPSKKTTQLLIYVKFVILIL